MKNKKILVVMGGVSSEREVSLRSGEAVYKALISMGYNAHRFILDEKNACDIVKEEPDLCVLELHGKGGEDGTIQGMLELMNIRYTGSGVASSANCMNKILTKKMPLKLILLQFQLKAKLQVFQTTILNFQIMATIYPISYKMKKLILSATTIDFKNCFLSGSFFV